MRKWKLLPLSQREDCRLHRTGIFLLQLTISAVKKREFSYIEKKKLRTGTQDVVRFQRKVVIVRNMEKPHDESFNSQQVKAYFRDTTETGTRTDPLEVFNKLLGPLRSKRYFGNHITEVISPDDPRSSQCAEAKRQEMKRVIRRRTWKIVYKNKLPRDANILEGRFFLAFNDTNTDREVRKARFAVQSFGDTLKNTWFMTRAQPDSIILAY